jgi:hypothetical protein
MWQPDVELQQEKSSAILADYTNQSSIRVLELHIELIRHYQDELARLKRRVRIEGALIWIWAIVNAMSLFQLFYKGLN